MERLRQERLEGARQSMVPFTERDRLRFVKGVGLRSLQLLEESGYRTVEDLSREDPDRLALRTGLGIKKAQQVQSGAVEFLQREATSIEDARARLREAEQNVESSEEPSGAAEASGPSDESAAADADAQAQGEET
jgi:N utilization substance protein A